jgi:hypothetical protein
LVLVETWWAHNNEAPAKEQADVNLSRERRTAAAPPASPGRAATSVTEQPIAAYRSGTGHGAF